jgi:cysteine desulfurase family protein
MTQPPRIYLDHAATSWPKPDAVSQAVQRFLRELGAPAGRSAYREAAEVERLVGEARWRVAQLLGVADPRRVIFTSNGTDALNLGLHGTLRHGDHVVTTVVEHNSVLRPLRFLEQHRGVRVTRVPCDLRGIVDPDEIAAAISPQTRLIALNHASNVTGALQPACEVGRIARRHGILFLLDAAQSLGQVSFQVAEVGCSLLAAPGHKGLLGPSGTGVLYLAPDAEELLQPTRQGGTGTQSEQDVQPLTLPERYESGSLNVAGILGLGAGVSWLLERGLVEIHAHKQQLLTGLLEGLHSMEGVTVHGPAEAASRVGVVSVTVDGYDPQEVASLLDTAYRIQVRAGLHCAPLMHQALGTAPAGTVRLSLGPWNTQEQIEVVLAAVADLAVSAPHA